jgi:hypothetical protein
VAAIERDRKAVAVVSHTSCRIGEVTCAPQCRGIAVCHCLAHDKRLRGTIGEHIGRVDHGPGLCVHCVVAE